MEPLADAEIDERLAGLAAGWRREGETIVRDLELADFAAAITLVDRIAAEAERANHHPDLLVHGYRNLRITLSTHSAGGLTGSDFALARAIDGL